MTTTAELKSRAEAAVRSRGAELIEISHRVHDHPELCFEERESSTIVADSLEAAGLHVDRGVCDLPTAFVATAGDGELHVGLCAEYDALPGMGHACGHNVIAAAAVGAALALAEVASDAGITLRVLGTPAEEGGGGKILMLERGAFSGLHAAMMVHPGPFEQDHMECLAASHFVVRYSGRTAHASGHPEEGLNAADALTIAQVAIGLLRQQLPTAVRVHGITTRGGEAPNAIPALVEADWFVRAPTLAELEKVQPRVQMCFEAGALATGCTLEIIPLSPPYSEFRQADDLVAVYRRNAEALGRRFSDAPPSPMSTDMANVSLVVPSIHPMLGIDSAPAVNHQPEFALAAISPPADRAVVDGAIAMAWTAIDVATEPIVRARLLNRG